MKQLYCYVDESGQDTQAKPGYEVFFIVSVVVTLENYQELESLCLRYERESQKGLKWSKSKRERRYHFIGLIFADQHFRETLRFTIHQSTEFEPAINYDDATVTTIRRTIEISAGRLGLRFDEFTADNFVDGISKAKQRVYKELLKGWHCQVRRVHRARDESYVLIRLADALAGLVREAQEGDEEARRLLTHARRHGIVLEI